jgi:hypothetical protein
MLSQRALVHFLERAPIACTTTFVRSKSRVFLDDYPHHIINFPRSHSSSVLGGAVAMGGGSIPEKLAFLHCTIRVAIQTVALKSAIIAGKSAYTQHDMLRKTKTPN